MMRCAHIASKTVCSDRPFIVYGHTDGLIGAADRFEDARELWKAELARCRERGWESDALLFEWHDGAWQLCGSLYDSTPGDPAVRVGDVWP